MPHPSLTIYNATLNTPNTSLTVTPGAGLAGNKTLLNSLMGWEDIEASVREHNLLDQSTLQALNTAELQFNSNPTPQHRSQFKTALRRALREAKDLEQHCSTQQAHYQDLLDQELAAQHQPQSYFASWTGWVINGVKYFFGSDHAGLVEKYREAALKQRELQINLHVVLDQISLSAEHDAATKGASIAPAATLDHEAKQDAAQRRLLSANDTVTVKKLVPTQIVEPGDAYDYTIDGTEIFEGNFSFLNITTADGKPFPQWLNKGLALRGSYNTPGFAHGVAVQGSLAFVACNDFGLQIIDVSNPAIPVLRGSYNTPGYADGVAVQGSLVFVADGDFGLQIIDVSNPSIPVLRGSYNTLGSALGIALQGSLAFVADPVVGLQIIDVSNPSIPVLRGSYNTLGSAFGIALQGSLAFVADDFAGLQIIDVSNVSNPVFRGGYATPGYAVGVAVQGPLIFIVNGNPGLQILDPRLLRLSGTPLSLDLSRRTLRLIAQDQNNFTQLAFADFDLVVTQLPQRQDNTLSTQSILPGETLSLLLDTDQLFNNRDGGFLHLAVDLVSTNQMPAWMNLTLSPVLQGHYNTPVSAFSVALQDSLAFVARYNGGLQIIDASNPAIPVLRRSYNTPGTAYDIAVQGSLAFVAASDFGLQIIDVSNPAMPILKGSYNTLGSARAVAVQGSLIFVADYGVGLQIIDVSNPASPILRGNANTSAAYDVALQGSLAFVAAQAYGLQIIDMSNVSNPILRGSYDTPGSANGIVVQGLLAFVADQLFGLQIIDVSNASKPVLRGNCDTPGDARGVALQGLLVFVADDFAGLQIIDVSNPAIPVLRGSYNTPGRAQGVALEGSLAFVVYDIAGLQILDISQWTLTATPTALDVGNHEVRVTVTNELGGSASDTFLLRVEGPPKFNSTIGQLYAKVGRPFSYFVPQGFVTDPNLDPITFSAHTTNQPTLLPWLNFNAVSGIFAGMPLSSDAGNHSITLGAQDNNLKTSHMITEQVFFLYVDHLPVLNQAIPPQLAGINTTFHYPLDPLTFVDQDGDVLIYDANERNRIGLPTWLSFNASSRTFTGFPTSNQTGEWNLVVGATDPYGSRAEGEFTVWVGHPPQVNLPVPNQLAGVNRPFAFTMDPNTFGHPDGDALTYQAQEQNGDALPNFISFNAQRLSFIGTPLVSDLGNHSLQLVATDSHGGYVGAPFLLQVTYFPEVVGTIPSSPLLRPGKSFNFTIPAGVFRDLDDPVLQYNASLANGAALPAWLQFDANTLTLTGTPTALDEGELDVVVVARDAQGGTAQAPITLSITPNFAPRARTPVSNQVAEVGNAFSLYVGPDAFTDNNGDILTYRATQVGGAPLPSWLAFDALRVGFTGTPGRSDTNTYSDRVITVDLSASDGIAAPAHTVFNINVRGTSWLALAVKIAAPIISALTTGYALYKNRSLFLNRYKPNRYQRVTDNHPKPGEHFERELNTPAEEIYGFATQIPRYVPEGWRRSLFFSYRDMPGTVQLPTWLIHDRTSNCLRSIKPMPDGLAGETLIIQVLGKGKVILEEFKLSIEKAHQDGLAEDRQDTGIEMTDMSQQLLAS